MNSYLDEPRKEREKDAYAATLVEPLVEKVKAPRKEDLVVEKSHVESGLDKPIYFWKKKSHEERKWTWNRHIDKEVRQNITVYKVEVTRSFVQIVSPVSSKWVKKWLRINKKDLFTTSTKKKLGLSSK